MIPTLYNINTRIFGDFRICQPPPPGNFFTEVIYITNELINSHKITTATYITLQDTLNYNSDMHDRQDTLTN